MTLCLEACTAYAAQAGGQLGAVRAGAFGDVVARLGEAQRGDGAEDDGRIVVEGCGLGGRSEGLGGTPSPEDITTAAARGDQRALAL